jgi:hypothetical protein
MHHHLRETVLTRQRDGLSPASCAHAYPATLPAGAAPHVRVTCIGIDTAVTVRYLVLDQALGRDLLGLDGKLLSPPPHHHLLVAALSTRAESIIPVLVQGTVPTRSAAARFRICARYSGSSTTALSLSRPLPESSAARRPYICHGLHFFMPHARERGETCGATSAMQDGPTDAARAECALWPVRAMRGRSRRKLRLPARRG